MIASNLLSNRKMIKTFLLMSGAAIILFACSKSPAPAGEVRQPAPTSQASPTQAPTQTTAQALQPAHTSEPEATRAPANPPEVTPTVKEPAASNINVCSLITKEEAEAALGSPVGDPVEQSYPPLYGCDYKTTNMNKVGISLVVYEDVQEAEAAFQMEIDLNHYEEVSGIGDRALRPEILNISVLKGKYELSIVVVNDSDDETRYEKAKELAEIALGRLP
ncbi:MAG: hypothetical protein ACM3PY_15865 [Omnitrophica WOR_2 bacterium]